MAVLQGFQVSLVLDVFGLPLLLNEVQTFFQI